MFPDVSRFTIAKSFFTEFLIFSFLLVKCIVYNQNNVGFASSIPEAESAKVFHSSATLRHSNLRGGYGDDNDTHKKTSRLLHYWLDDEGKRVYTVKKVDPFGRPTYSAYPARFSPRQ
jgi:hypothetical protein